MTDPNQTQNVEQVALTTAEQLLPVLIQAISAGAQASTPQLAVIAMVAQVIPPLLQSFSANSAQIQQLMTALVTEITASQAGFDAIAKQRGLTGAPVPPMLQSQAA